MDETLVQAGWARSRIWAAQETPTLYRVFPSKSAHYGGLPYNFKKTITYAFF